MAPINGAAVFATLLTNDAYLPGAMVLGHSLKDRGAKAPLVAFILADKLSSDTINELRTVYHHVVPIQQITNKSPANLYLMNRPDLISSFTKIELWRQTQFKRIIYMDADMVALRAPNELLTLDTDFAAVPDIGWPDCFNSGMLVLNPNMSDYYALYALAQRGISFDGADQGLLNTHFREWERLSFVYNCTPSGHYQYVPAYRHFQSSIAAVHFIGADKPWTLGRDSMMNTGVYGELLGMWWSVYDKHYRPKAINYYDSQSFGSKRTVQDYVRGDQPVYVQQPPPEQSVQTSQPPEIHVQDAQSDQATVELTSSDAPISQAPQDLHPTPAVEQRQFSAPHFEWDPARAPPPSSSKPEAANFPTTIYDMSHEMTLFQPPRRYPEAPKDMWYEVPQKVPEPVKQKQIFPWESRAPKATRVFPQPRQPSPPPILPPALPSTASTEEPMSNAEETRETSPPQSPPDPSNVWDSFQQRTNAWDDMPEIERYVQAITQPRKGKIQVLYNTLGQRSPRSNSGATTPTNQGKRRPSLKLTDFPTKDERPSLPVTPAPIRRPSFWGNEKETEEGTLPTADGVPKQEEWVRRFSQYPQLEFPRSHSHPPVHALRDDLSFKCQYCGRQNPMSKLEELQRRQSEALLSPMGTRELGDVPEHPAREMPGSSSREALVEATISHISPTKVPKLPKPILKQPHFELGQEKVASPTQKPTEAAEEAEPMDPLSESGGQNGMRKVAQDPVAKLIGSGDDEAPLESGSKAPILTATKA